MSPDASSHPGEHPWGPPLLVCGLVLGVAAASLLGWLTRLGGHLDFSSQGPDLALGVLGLGPLAFYAFSLERGKAAPALRSPLASWLLFVDLHACVQVSGGLHSPLWGAYPLLVVFVARNAGALNAAALAGLTTLLEAFPLWAQAHAPDGGAPAGTGLPDGLALALPLLGFVLGVLSAGSADRAPATDRAPAGASPEPRAEPSASALPASASPSFAPAAPAAASVPPPSPPPPSPALPAAEPAAAGYPGPWGASWPSLDRDLAASLALAFHSHPSWNALSLWWGDASGVSLRRALVRRGSPVRGAQGPRVEPGQGHLGLALRERKALGIDPLAAGAVLPYAEAPYQALCLRVLPLEDEGSLVGLLACDRLEAGGFGVDEAAALDALGRVLVGHSQNAARMERLSAAGGRTQKLYAAAQALAELGLEREALLERFGALLKTLVPCDSWALGLRGEEDSALERLAGGGYLENAPKVLSLDRAPALAATLSQSEGAVLFNSEPGAQIPAVLLEGLAGAPRHFLLAPLRQGGRLSGVLKLDRAVEPFGEEDRDAAYIFARQAALTLENARLYALHRRLATTDGLTGLYNHRYFQERLALELEQSLRAGRPLSLALMDIDFFKKFNDTFGHQEGDAVLRRVAGLLKDHARPDRDVCCRYGGEEFVVVLPDCDVVEARQRMEALRADCAARLSGGTGGQTQGITLSVGIATYPAAAREQRELIHSADAALYKAKHAGRNRVCSFKDV